ncbi:two-component system, cell cycle sensor histidine kinase and response regulator CckA [uncultured bacterium]|nr:two-component system, cell cycle sensor histidine kinase and response regulator CckA [uncultured bacterium]
MKSVKLQNETLFVRLLAALVLLAVLPSAVIGYLVYNINRTHHIEQVSKLMESLAADRELMTRLIIEKQRDSLGFLAKDPKTAVLAEELAAGRGQTANASFLEVMVNRSPFFGGLSLVDTPTGKMKTAGAFPGTLLAKSIKEIKLSHGKPFTRIETLPGGRAVLILGQPVSAWGDAGGAALLGVASAAMLDDIYRDTSMLGRTGESFLSDSSGIALTSLRYSYHKGMSHPIDAAAMKDCLLGNTRDFVITPDYAGEMTAMSYRPVKGYGGCVMVHIRETEVLAPVNDVRNMITAIVLTVVLAFTLISILVARKLLALEKVRARLEDELAAHLSSMETAVAERTSELNSEIKSRIEAERRLVENKAFLEDIVRNVHEAIWTAAASPKGGFVFMWSNENADRMLCAINTKASGRSLKEVFGPVLGERLAARYAECAEKGVVHFEESLDTGGVPRVLLMTLVPVRGEGGQVTEIIGSAMDITERKQLEGEMVKAQKLESLGVLAGGIAHDFNNLLAAIRLNTSMLKQDRSLDPERLEMLKVIEASSSMAANLTNQLLTFAKGGKPVKELLRVGPFLNDVAGFSLRGTKTACSLDISEDLLDIEADPGQMTQVINNILINAGQAMPDGGVVKLSADNVEVSGPQTGLPLKPGKYVKISVEDKGVGIPEETLSKIFDPYFTTKKDGNGLGLASSYSIIKNHGGFIAASSTAGQGTRFEVYIPGLPRKDSTQFEEPAVPPPSSGRVLVMDDDDLVRTSVCRVLDTLGYDYVEAADGLRAALEYKKLMESGKKPDAVILDLTVKAGMGGEEAASRILELDPFAKLFVSSGYSDNPVTANYREYGFCGFLQKPYDARELDKKLRAALAEAKK